MNTYSGFSLNKSTLGQAFQKTEHAVSARENKSVIRMMLVRANMYKRTEHTCSIRIRLCLPYVINWIMFAC